MPNRPNVNRMNEHREQPPEKTMLPFKWVESDSFEMKPTLRSSAGALPSSDTAFLREAKPPGRANRIPGT